MILRALAQELLAIIVALIQEKIKQLSLVLLLRLLEWREKLIQYLKA